MNEVMTVHAVLNIIQAYEAGCSHASDAAHRIRGRHSLEDNPYEKVSDEWYAWERGFKFVDGLPHR